MSEEAGVLLGNTDGSAGEGHSQLLLQVTFLREGPSLMTKKAAATSAEPQEDWLSSAQEKGTTPQCSQTNGFPQSWGRTGGESARAACTLLTREGLTSGWAPRSLSFRAGGPDGHISREDTTDGASRRNECLGPRWSSRTPGSWQGAIFPEFSSWSHAALYWHLLNNPQNGIWGC